MWNSALVSLAMPVAVSHGAVGLELHTNDVLDTHDLAASHADRFGNVADILADARARDFVRR